MTQTSLLITKQSTVSKNNKLPNILPPSNTITYSQRYEHMTKIANYNQMTESLIWKQYQKLRICLKQLNDEVLYHMQRKAYTNNMKQPISKQSANALILLEEEKRLNSEKFNLLTHQFSTLEHRLNQLINNQNILEQLQIQRHSVLTKIKQIKFQNKAFNRKQKLDARNLQNGPTLAQRLMDIDIQLGFYQKKCSKRNAIFKIIEPKIKQYQEKCIELQRTIQLRLQQFSNEQNYIAQQINFQRFQQLKQQKQILLKYEPIYKKNYLMKLKQLENLVNSIKKHDQIIQQTESNIINMRNQIDIISANFSNNKKRSTSSVMQINKQKRQSQQNTKKINNQISQQEINIAQKTQFNDKNTQDYQSTHPPTVRITDNNHTQ